MERLEDVLDIRAHARVRWFLTPEYSTVAGVRANIREVAPEFPLWDEEHRRTWAEVAHVLTAGGIERWELQALYEEGLLWAEEVADKEFKSLPPEGEIWAPSPSGEGEERVEIIQHTVEPAELARRCSMIGPGARFVLRGSGRHVVGSAKGWRSLCRHRRWMCHWCGKPVRNRAQWYRFYGHELWPYVGIVPGSEWHRAPGARPRQRH